jgi:hypothetical protein
MNRNEGVLSLVPESLLVIALLRTENRRGRDVRKTSVNKDIFTRLDYEISLCISF